MTGRAERNVTIPYNNGDGSICVRFGPRGILTLGLLSGLAPRLPRQSGGGQSEYVADHRCVDAERRQHGHARHSPGGRGAAAGARRDPAGDPGEHRRHGPPGTTRRAGANLSVPFATGSATLSPGAEQVLDRLAAALASQDWRIPNFGWKAIPIRSVSPMPTNPVRATRRDGADYLSQHASTKPG